MSDDKRRLKRLSRAELLELLLACLAEEGSPTVDAARVKAELSHERYRQRYVKAIRSTLSSLVVVAAIAVLVANLWLPTLQIYGSSMAPTLADGNIVVATRGADFQTGDLVAFYLGNKLLVKRVIAGPGDWVDIAEDGTVSVNGGAIDEPYVSDKARGECSITLPYQVPDGRWFVMGDHRSTSADSRSNAVGCVSEEQIVGKIRLRIWPLGTPTVQ